MPAKATHAIPIQVELGQPLEPLTPEAFRDQLRQTLADRAAASLAGLHLPAAAVTVTPSPAPVAFQVRVHGTVQPLPMAVLEQHTPAPVPDPSEAHRAQTTDATSTGQAGDENSDLAERLSDLAWQAIARRPSCLLGPDHAAWLPFPAWLRRPGREQATHPDDVTAYLLDLGVRAPERERLATELAQQPDAPVDLAEMLFEEYRVGVVELHLSPEVFRTATGRAPLPSDRIHVSDASIEARVRDQVASFSNSLRNRQGLHLPPVELVLAPDLPEPGCAVRINEHRSLPVRLQADGGQPRAKEPSSRPSRPPSVVRRLPGSVGRLATEHQEAFPLTTVLAAMQEELDRAAYRFIGMTEVEYMLARLEVRLPALVQAALSRFSIAELTRVLRALVWEHTPLRDLRAILDGVLCFAWVPLDPERRGVVVDERVVLPAALPPGAADDLPYLLEGARGALAPGRRARWAKRSLLVLGGSLERRLEQVQSSWATGDAPPADARTLREELQAAVRTATSDVGDHALVTSAGARWIAHALLADNLPHLAVISRHELESDAPRNSAGVIRAQRRRSSAKAARPSAPGDR